MWQGIDGEAMPHSFAPSLGLPALNLRLSTLPKYNTSLLISPCLNSTNYLLFIFIFIYFDLHVRPGIVLPLQALTSITDISVRACLMCENELKLG